MKFQYIRRVGVLVFVLFLALTLTLALTAPGRAAAGEEDASPSPSNLEFRITVDGAIKNDVTVDVKIGDKLNLGNQWNPSEPGSCSYSWTVTDENGNKPSGVLWQLDSSDKTGRKLIIKVVNPNDKAVIITSTAHSLKTGEDYTASCTLNIDGPVLAVFDENQDRYNGETLMIGKEVKLDAICPGNSLSNDIKDNINFEWTYDKSILDIPEKTSNGQSAATMTALAAGRTSVTVDMYWKPGQDTVFGFIERQKLGTYSFSISVTEPILTITNAPGTLKIGGSPTLKAELSNVAGTPTPTYKWVSSNKDVLECNETTGQLTAKQAGSAQITVTASWTVSGKTATATSEPLTITVEKATWTVYDSTDESKVDIGPSLSLKIGEEKTLKAEASNIDSSITITGYTWTSSADDVVSVVDGKLTAKKTGSATITITPTGLSDGVVIENKTLTVNVSSSTLKIVDPSKVPEVAVTTLNIHIGEEVSLKAVLGDVVSSDVKYSWTTDDESGEFVKLSPADQTETAVTGKKAGTVNITIQAKLGDNVIGEAKCTLNIAEPKLTIEIEKDENKVTSLPAMQIGEKAKLTVGYVDGTAPVGAGDPPTYQWECMTEDGEESGVVTFDAETGETVTITASKPGTAFVKVTATWTADGTEWKTATATYKLKVEVVGPELKIFSGTTDVTGDKVVLEPNKPVTLTVELTNGPTTGVTYEWELIGDDDNSIKLVENGEEATVTASALENPVTIRVTAKWEGLAEDEQPYAECTLTFAVLVKEFWLEETELTVMMRETKSLTPKFEPEDATNQNVTWESDNTSVATVDQDGNVTGVSIGKAKITAKVVDGENTFTATCEVEVIPPNVAGFTFSTSSPIIWAKSDPTSWDLGVALFPEGAKLGEGDRIIWSVEIKDGNPEMKNPLKVSGAGLTASENGMTAEGTGMAALTAQLTSGDPGVFIVTVTYVPANGAEVSESIEVIVSGITLTRTKVNLLVGQNATIAIDQIFGFADTGTTTDVEWSTSDPSVVTVLHGGMTAWKLGKAVITVTKNGYTAECEVEVTEDGEAVAGPYHATTGNPLNMSEVWDELDQMSHIKTGDRDEDGEWIKGTGSPLAYITNLSVPTSQGTLYYNYNSEANTGSGIRLIDRFSKTPDSTQKNLNLLYFVPKQGFKGTAEISFIGWAKDGTSFSGVIKVEVSGADTKISYRTKSDTPLYFLADDFDAFCRSQTGRGVSYVTFDLPHASQGVLYYNYLTGGGIRVSASTRFYQSGRYTIGDVCFVPNAAFAGEVEIRFHIVDTAGQAFDGWVVVNVIAADGDSSGVYLSGGQGDPITLQASQFNAICQETIHDTLNFVTFKLPALEDGILYYNYRGAGDFESRVNANTRYFFSGVPGINNVTFVPAANATGRIAISYTGYGMSGNTFDGTLYIDLGGVNRTTIYYFVSKGSSVTFSRADFNDACLNQLGVSVDYVKFGTPDDSSLGTLYYDYRSSSNYKSVGSYFYYFSPKSGQRGLSLISFRAKSAAGTVKIPYTAYSGTGSNQKSISGYVVIQVGSLTPVDTGVSCTTSGQVGLSSSALSSACRPAMSGNLSYIEITSVPDPSVGRLYLNYNGFGTGTVVNPGDRFNCTGSPNIDKLSFVPHAGFTGEAEITYIGYSGNGEEQVSGRIMVNVTRSVKSRYFNDMGGYEWAIDSVDYLRLNGAVEGVGNNSFAPNRNVTRGDFILMLVRAYGFTASGSASYHDVSASDYYAEAVRIATVLNIVQGYNGYFNPTSPISRQDAMVMIFRSLEVSGMTVTNGLTADFSAFYDGGQIDSYALKAVGSLLQMGVVEGDGNGYLRPRGMLNRAEAAKLLHTIMTL